MNLHEKTSVSPSNCHDDETPDKWLEPEKYLKLLRLNYIEKLKSHVPRTRCPECKTYTIVNDGWEEYCSNCGLVTMSAYPVTAGEIYQPPYGKK